MEDNYVDELFLKGMAHKNSFPNLHYPQMIKNTIEIIHVINSVFLQLVLFVKLMNSDKKSNFETVLSIVTIALCVVGYITYSYFKFEENRKAQASGSTSIYQLIFGWELFNNLKQLLFLSMILSLTTPVLGSLTVTYTDETIILFYFFLVFVHLIYYDYEMII